MAELHAMCGIPGCGKSTVADELKHEHNAVVVNPDEIRRMLTGDPSNQDRNAEVFEHAHRMTRSNLAQDNNVIFDATNVTPEARAALLDHAQATGSGAHLHLFNTELPVAKQRNLGRDRIVSDDVLDRMHQQLVDSQWSIPDEGWDEIHYYD